MTDTKEPEDIHRKSYYPITATDDRNRTSVNDTPITLPNFILPIYDYNGSVESLEQLSSTITADHRNINVYWNHYLGGLAFQYPCGDVKLFRFHREHEFDDFIEALITLQMEAKERHTHSTQARALKDAKDALKRIDNSRVAYTNAIATDTNKRDTCNQQIDANNAHLETLEAHFITAEQLVEKLTPPKAVTEPQILQEDV